MATCDYCGADVTDADVVLFDDAAVCPRCKPEYVQRLQKGGGKL